MDSKKSKKDGKQRGTVRINVNHNEATRQLVAKGSFDRGVLEFVVNAIDAYAANEDLSSGDCLVNIEIKHGEYIRIKDWGAGFTLEDIKGYYSFLTSKKKGDPTKTGRIGSGRTFAFSFAKGIEVTSVSAEFRKPIQFTFTEEHLYQEGQEVPYMEVDAPPHWHVSHDGTGTVINLTGIDWSRVKGKKNPEEYLREWLPTRLSDFAAEVVRVNDKPLKALKYMKEPLRGEKVVPHLGGVCRWSLYIPLAEQRMESSIQLGGSLMPIISLPKFLAGLRNDLPTFFPELLRDGSVVGHVLIPGLNEYRLHDSESLDAKVYDRFAYDVMVLLNEIGKEADVYFADTRAEAEREEHARFLRDLTDEVNAVSGFDPANAPPGDVVSGGQKKPGKPIPRAPFLVNPSDLAIVKGTSTPTVINAYSATSGQFVCTVEGQPCVSVTQQGNREFIVTGDSLGKATLVYTDKNDSKKCVRTPVEVVKAAGLQLTPVRAQIIQGEIGRAAIAHAETHNGAVPVYSVDAKPGEIRLATRQRGGKKSVGIEVSDKCPLGTYTITAKLPSKGLTATAVRTVIAGAEQNPLMCIEGKYYRISPSKIPQGVLAQVISEDFDLTGGSSKSFQEVRVYVGHPLIEGCEEVQRRLLVLDSIFQVHLDAMVKLSELEPDQRMTRFDQIRNTVLGGIRKKDGGKKKRT
jgi:hypothetical protein